MSDFRAVLYYDDAAQLPPTDRPLLVLAVRIVEVEDAGTLRQYVHGVQPGLGIRYGRIFGDPFGAGIEVNPPIEIVDSPAVGFCILPSPARGTVSDFPGSPLVLALPGGSLASANWVTVTGGAIDADAEGIAYDDLTGEIELSQPSDWQISFSLGAAVTALLSHVVTVAVWDYTALGAEVITDCRSVIPIVSSLTNKGLSVSGQITLPARTAHSKYRLRMHSTLANTADVHGWTVDYKVTK